MLIPFFSFEGEFEGTLLHSFHKGSAFRRWLMREDCPPILRTCRKLLDKAFGYVSSGEYDDDTEDSDIEIRPEELLNKYLRTPADMIPELGAFTDARFLSRIPAPLGYYSIPSAQGKGNSYVHFHPGGNQTSRWIAGRIHYIFEKNGTTKLALRRNLSVEQETDPFSAFWDHGFQAKLVSTMFSEELEVVEPQWLLGHTAMWELNDEMAVVLALPKVSPQLPSAALRLLIEISGIE